MASTYDFSQANFCARYLLKKGWHGQPWERRGTIYQQQTAFVTNLVIAYGRPFVKSEGWPGFPWRLTNFDSKQRDLHKRLLRRRNKIFAHSDSENFNFRPIIWRDLHTTIEQSPSYHLTAEDTECVRVMTSDVIKAISFRLKQLHAELAEKAA